MVKFQGKHYIQRHSTVRIDIISHDYNSVEKGKKWEEFRMGLLMISYLNFVLLMGSR